MPYGIYLSAEGAHAQDRRLTILANNLANVETVGFKRQLAICQARYTEPVNRGLESPGTGRWSDLSGGVVVSMTKTDFSPGPLKETRSPTDFAIRGEGFFTVQKGDEVFLTRAGNFQLNGKGQLVTQYGGEQYLVLNDAGQPIVIDGSRPWRVNPQGVVEQEGLLQNIAVVRPASKDSLVPVGENLFRPTAQPSPVPLAQRQVAQGYLEMSSVQPTLAMVELLEASRLLEANLAMVQTQDQMLSNLFNRVLRAS
ncbi:MAG TPA: flagellar hook-basal body protein [Thermogutta sp.]|nr:flagellar hook-basal body protein [Thermogutta sp.]HOP77257.1 flagellar hook-basal body protein [Thermogutta sp.]HPU07431.1 flagellar hook-basal body protein [Thermogutta sp.]HQF14480.1 flagellar hook-basal body protein [Thermogutta sp.]